MSFLDELHADAMRESEEYRLGYLAEVAKWEKIDLLRREILADLTARRKRLKLSQKDLAAKIETSQSFVSQIEKDKTSVCLSTLIELAEALDLEIRLVPKAAEATQSDQMREGIAAETLGKYSSAPKQTTSKNKKPKES
jgi:transcriptional regulator with XRE-family HTH domain